MFHFLAFLGTPCILYCRDHHTIQFLSFNLTSFPSSPAPLMSECGQLEGLSKVDMTSCLIPYSIFFTIHKILFHRIMSDANPRHSSYCSRSNRKDKACDSMRYRQILKQTESDLYLIRLWYRNLLQTNANK